jgi:hypothetical protein
MVELYLHSAYVFVARCVIKHGENLSSLPDIECNSSVPQNARHQWQMPATLALKCDVIMVVVTAEFAQYGKSLQHTRDAYKENPRRLLEVGLSVVLELGVTQ